jgi:chromosome segregation ATPase
VFNRPPWYISAVPLFGPRQFADSQARDELTRLRDELTRVESVVRQVEQEVIDMHSQVRRWMRRAVAAERAVERNQEPSTNGHGSQPVEVTPAQPTPARPFSRITLRGARQRIAMRQRLEREQAFLRQVSEGAPSPDTVPAVEPPAPPQPGGD